MRFDKWLIENAGRTDAAGQFATHYAILIHPNRPAGDDLAVWKTPDTALAMYGRDGVCQGGRESLLAAARAWCKSEGKNPSKYLAWDWNE